MNWAIAVVIVSALVWTAPAWPQTRNEGAFRLACVSAAETRDLFVANKLVQPVRIMREAARAMQAEPIDIQLCRAGGTLVYDVTLLQRDGRVIHRLANASNGAAYNGPPAEKEPSAEPRPVPAPRSEPNVYAGPRPGPDFYPGPRPNPFIGPRIEPGPFLGPRPGPNFYPGPRPGPGPNFYPGPRAGPNGFPGPRPQFNGFPGQGSGPGQRGPGAVE